MANEKRVLVRFGERSRPVTFTSGSDSGSDADLLLKEVQKTFSDQMGRRVEENEFFLQVKDEDWAGEFVDVAATQAIPDKSVVKVLRKEKMQEKHTTPGCSSSQSQIGASLHQQPGVSSVGASKQLRLSLSSAGITLVNPTVEEMAILDHSMDKGYNEAEIYIREQARFYGRDPAKPLSPYQVKINLAAEELAVATPNLLDTRQKLLELARAKVDDDGYVYKKGKSRSKRLRGATSDEGERSEQPKRIKTSGAVRDQRISHIDETIKDTNKQITFKELRREQASNSHKYQLCESITEEISVLKQKRYELLTELKLLKRKQQKSAWYKKKANRRDQESASHSASEQESSTTPCPSSSRSSLNRSPTPSTDLSALDCSPFSPGPTSPVPRFSPPQPPTRQIPLPSPTDTVLLSSASESDGESYFR